MSFLHQKAQPFPDHLAMVGDAHADAPSESQGRSVWRLDVPEVGSAPHPLPEEWLRSLQTRVQFLWTSQPCQAQDVYPLGTDASQAGHLPPDLIEMSQWLADRGMAERSLHVVVDRASTQEAVPDLSLLGLQPTRLDPAGEAALVARLLGGPHAFLRAVPTEMHLGPRPLVPFGAGRRTAGKRSPHPGLASNPLHEGIRTWNDLALPSHLLIERDHLSLEDGAVILLTLDGLPRELGRDALLPLLSMPMPMDLSVRLVPLESDAVVRYLTRRLRDLRSSRILGAGGDTFAADDAIADAQALREALYIGTTRLWQVSATLAVWGDDLEQARRHAQGALARLRQGGFLARTATFRQWDAVLALLPSQRDRLRNVHNVTTEAVSALLPLGHVSPGRAGILLGRHAQDASPVHFPRLSQANPSALYLGTPGSGKSALGKVELRRALLARPADRALIVDPEGEYEDLVRALNGVELHLDRNPEIRVSPFVGAERTPGLTADLLVGCLQGGELDASGLIRSALRQFLADTADTHTALESVGLEHFVPYLRRSQAGLAERMEDLLDGPLYALASGGTVDPGLRVMAVGLRGAEPHLLPALMTLYTHVLLDHLKPAPQGLRWLTVDEFHLFLSHQAGARLLVQLTKRARKHGVVLTAMTQHITDLLGHPDGQAILAAVGSVALFEPGMDLRPFADALHLRASDLEWVDRLRTGRTLIFSNGHMVPTDIELSSLERRLVETRPLAVRDKIKPEEPGKP